MLCKAFIPSNASLHKIRAQKDTQPVMPNLTAPSTQRPSAQDPTHKEPVILALPSAGLCGSSGSSGPAAKKYWTRWPVDILSHQWPARQKKEKRREDQKKKEKYWAIADKRCALPQFRHPCYISSQGYIVPTTCTSSPFSSCSTGTSTQQPAAKQKAVRHLSWWQTNTFTRTVHVQRSNAHLPVSGQLQAATFCIIPCLPRYQGIIRVQCRRLLPPSERVPLPVPFIS